MLNILFSKLLYYEVSIDQMLGSLWWNQPTRVQVLDLTQCSHLWLFIFHWYVPVDSESPIVTPILRYADPVFQRCL